MASNASMDGVPVTVSVPRRHGAHDSALSDHTRSEFKNYDTAQMRIRELEEENGLLAERTTAASQRFADYENEIRVLREQLREQHHRRQDSAPSDKSDDHPQSAPPAGLSRFGSFMRKASPAHPPPDSVGSREHELEASLVREQTARIAAEAKVKEVNSEIEELSASLFQQANDMVAAERRENARLRDKIKELEAAGGDLVGSLREENERLQGKLKLMEQREVERKRRLEKLESAQKRIDRVRTMLAPR